MTEFKPILTVTLNPAIDRLVESTGFKAGKDNRTAKGVSFAGGKGINVSRALKCLGVKSVTAGFAGGANGQNLLRDLLLEGLEHNFVFTQGETRVNLTIRDPKNGQITRVIDSGPAIDKKDLSSFRDKFQRLAAKSGWTVLSGRGIAGTPKDFYKELTRTAKENSWVIVDTSGDDLAAALKGRPCVVRINLEEAQTLLKKKLASAGEQRAGLKKILALGAEHVVISLGKDGAIASDGKVFYEAKGPVIKDVGRRLDGAGTRSHIACSLGCGDAMTAGFIYGFRPAEDFLEGLVAGIAAGTASCLSEKPGALRRADFERIISKVRVKVF